jgi:hypothetical protein
MGIGPLSVDFGPSEGSNTPTAPSEGVHTVTSSPSTTLTPETTAPTDTLQAPSMAGTPSRTSSLVPTGTELPPPYAGSWSGVASPFPNGMDKDAYLVRLTLRTGVAGDVVGYLSWPTVCGVDNRYNVVLVAADNSVAYFQNEMASCSPGPSFHLTQQANGKLLYEEFNGEYKISTAILSK